MPRPRRKRNTPSCQIAVDNPQANVNTEYVIRLPTRAGRLPHRSADSPKSTQPDPDAIRVNDPSRPATGLVSERSRMRVPSTSAYSITSNPSSAQPSHAARSARRAEDGASQNQVNQP